VCILSAADAAATPHASSHFHYSSDGALRDTAEAIFASILKDQLDRRRQALEAFLTRSALAVGAWDLRGVGDVLVPVLFDDRGELVLHGALHPNSVGPSGPLVNERPGLPSWAGQLGSCWLLGRPRRLGPALTPVLSGCLLEVPCDNYLDERLSRNAEALRFSIERGNHPQREVNVHPLLLVARASCLREVETLRDIPAGVEPAIKILRLHTTTPPHGATGERR